VRGDVHHLDIIAGEQIGGFRVDVGVRKELPAPVLGALRDQVAQGDDTIAGVPVGRQVLRRDAAAADQTDRRPVERGSRGR
jgi:hypothetical protein